MKDPCFKSYSLYLEYSQFTTVLQAWNVADIELQVIIGGHALHESLHAVSTNLRGGVAPLLLLHHSRVPLNP